MRDWISTETWILIEHRAMLRCTGHLSQAGRRRLNRWIRSSLACDRAAHAVRVGEAIEMELAAGNAKEAFRHLKGWYCTATEMQAKPCRQTMVRQTDERVDLYRQRQSPGDPFPVNVPPTPIHNDVPSDGKIHTAVANLSNGQAPGASGMCAEHVKARLHGIHKEEHPDAPTNSTAGDNWRLFVQLVQAVWTTSTIPRQLLWIIVVLIPKGGGDFDRIGLLESIWKVLERIVDLQLAMIDLHDTFHGCHTHRGTGTVVIEAKLAQQLASLELQPFYGVFLDLCKAFDAANRDRCLMILEGYGAGPWMIRLIRT
jgi:hypothetical protein